MARQPTDPDTQHDPKRTRPHPGTSLEVVDPALFDVRVHNDAFKPPSIGAEAYAGGNRIHPHSTGQHTAAHEATHVVQQR
jgi:hypothetical protein